MSESKKFLGEFEQMVIAAVLGLGDEAYGVTIIDAIASHTGRKVRSGALSVTLDRMERKGLIRTELGDGKGERAGYRCRYVRVTARGVELAQQSRQALQNLWHEAGEAYEKP